MATESDLQEISRWVHLFRILRIDRSFFNIPPKYEKNQFPWQQDVICKRIREGSRNFGYLGIDRYIFNIPSKYEKKSVSMATVCDLPEISRLVQILRIFRNL